ncbi:MAG: GAF domain-containing protein, partial [Okeania sp. SIO2F4]|uniref:ATP-binding protein n=1 Tax=Okeania sp. SIO2F4 TaxID=2607790 RepID=UPI001429F42D
PAEQDYLIQLNFKSGEKAKGSAAYAGALKYFQTALSLLDVESWQTNYPLALKLHENYAEAAYLIGDFELMESIIEQVIERGQDLLDLVKVHEIKIQAKMAQIQQLSALRIGIYFLGLLGIQIPESPQIEDLQVEIAAISQLMEGKAIADLANLPLMENRDHLAKVKILANLLPACYQAKPSLFPWISCKLMQLLIQYGNTVNSSFIYSCYGIVCVTLQDFTSATEYGKLACKLDLSPQTGDSVSGTHVTGACINHCSTHVKEAIPILLKAYQAGLETGNFQFGGFAIGKRSEYLYLMGHSLSNVKLEMATASHALATMKQENTLAGNQTFEQAILNLLGESETPWELIGTAYNETESVPLKTAANDRNALHYVYLNKLILCYLFDRIPQAVENAALAESYLDGVAGFLDNYVWNFYDSLTQLAHYGDAETSVQKSILEKVETNQKKMQYWATHAPMNAQHKDDLVAAERHRILGERFQAIELYDRAIAGAKENEYLQEEAVANELAAKFYLDWGKEKVAAGYMQEAYYCYARWEAKAKINQLEEKYPQLLSPILEKREPHNFHNSFTSTQVSDIVTTTTVFLDYASAIKASRAISEEIELDALLCKFMQLLIENAGANKGVLLLNNSNNWEIVAQFNNETCDLSTTPVAESKTLPSSIINTVKRTQKTLLLNNNFEQNNTFSADPYLLKQQPKSLLCIPIINQGKLMGILYLENNFTTEAFTPERIEVLNLLTAQTAISIENARLYQDLEAKVEQRTQHLQQTLQKLQQTQAQLIQTEKMSSLGQMIAGIAHEINNPITFISGNITHAREYFLDLLELLNLYQENLSAPSAAIEEKLQEIELEFLCEDLEKIFDSMETGSTRIRQIILGLRNFSRLDEQGMKRVNIHEGLENTLMILQHRLRGSGCRPDIAIIKDYAQLPPVNCYASQLNQVFLQILTNAIDALTTSKAPDCPEIRIATQMQNQYNIRISIADNGPGMSKTVEQRIFDPFFTTKPVGQGTGLGLFISYQIVTEQHRGQLQCISQEGKGTKFMIDIPI